MNDAFGNNKWEQAPQQQQEEGNNGETRTTQGERQHHASDEGTVVRSRNHGRPRRLSAIATLTCPECGKVFTGSRTHSGVHSNYKRHLATHAETKPFPCPYCRAGFTTKQNMKRHVTKLHPYLATPSQGPQAAPKGRQPGSMPLLADGAVGVDAITSEDKRPEVVKGEMKEGSKHAMLTSSTPSRSANKSGAHHASHSPPRQPPPFALPYATSHSSGEERSPGGGECAALSPLRCKFCGKYFAWRSTHAFHEHHCPQRNDLMTACNVAGKGDQLLQSPKRGQEAKRARSASFSSRASSRTSSPASLASLHLEKTPPLCSRTESSSQARKRTKQAPTTAPVPGMPVKKVFFCPNCELEVSTKQHLLRHQRYYCPFREDAFADPLEDAVHDKEATVGAGKPHLGPCGKADRCALGATGSTEEKEADIVRRRAALLSAKTGLKYYENANASISISASSLSADSECVVECSSGDDVVYVPTDPEDEEDGEDDMSKSAADLGSLIDDEEVFGVSGNDDEEREAWLEQRVSLDYKRRHSTRRRQRRILLRRLRARERGSAKADPLTAPRPFSDSLDQHTGASARQRPVAPVLTAVEKSGDPSLPLLESLHHSSTVSPSVEEAEHKPVTTSPPAALDATQTSARQGQQQQQSAPAKVMLPILTDSLRQRAQALLEARWSRGTAKRHTCTTDGCMASFPNRGRWLAHVKRVHPGELAASLESGRESPKPPN